MQKGIFAMIQIASFCFALVCGVVMYTLRLLLFPRLHLSSGSNYVFRWVVLCLAARVSVFVHVLVGLLLCFRMFFA